MNRMQKVSWLMVVSTGSGLVLSALAVTVGYFMVGFPKAWAGLGFLGLSGFGGLGPLIFRRDPGPVQADERDNAINLLAARAAFALSYLVVGVLTMGIWLAYKSSGKTVIAIEVLPMVWFAAFLTAMFTHAVIVIREYGKDNKAMEGESV